MVIEDFCKHNPILIQGLIEQYSAFLSLDNLINKVISAYNYFNNINHPNTINLISFLNQIIDKELTNNTQIFRSKVFNTILNSINNKNKLLFLILLFHYVKIQNMSKSPILPLKF